MSNTDVVLPAIESASTATLWGEVAAILSGLIAGGRYGLKIRIPHAFGKWSELRVIVWIVIVHESFVATILLIRPFSDDVSVWKSPIFCEEIEGRRETCSRTRVQFSCICLCVQGGWHLRCLLFHSTSSDCPRTVTFIVNPFVSFRKAHAGITQSVEPKNKTKLWHSSWNTSTIK